MIIMYHSYLKRPKGSNTVKSDICMLVPFSTPFQMICIVLSFSHANVLLQKLDPNYFIIDLQRYLTE